MGLRVALLVSGASGMLLPRRLLAALVARPKVERIHIVVSSGASQVLRHELGGERTGAADLVAAALADRDREEVGKIAIHRDSALDAAISSGSYRLAGTVILPCSAGTLGALASGAARTLIHRAGAVALKERWPLVLGFRETPLNLVHLENLRRLAYLGAVILPPIPAFYIGGEEIERFAEHYALRVLDHLGLGAEGEANGASLRWPLDET